MLLGCVVDGAERLGSMDRAGERFPVSTWVGGLRGGSSDENLNQGRWRGSSHGGTAETCKDLEGGHCWAGLFQNLEVQSSLPLGTGVLVEGSPQTTGQGSEGR